MLRANSDSPEKNGNWIMSEVAEAAVILRVSIRMVWIMSL
jgi:hypothetical protein